MAEHVSTEQAAERVGVAYRTLLRWVKAGQITPAMHTPGGQFRWDIADLRRQLGMPPDDSVLRTDT
jgi:excisionase family DNA binding protein